jgi:hypothetical protein
MSSLSPRCGDVVLFSLPRPEVLPGQIFKGRETAGLRCLAKPPERQQKIMGNWNINIQGVGCHHNKANPSDADRMFDEFVAKLSLAGHTVQHATFTHGALETPETLQQRRKWAEEDAAKAAQS